MNVWKKLGRIGSSGRFVAAVVAVGLTLISTAPAHAQGRLGMRMGGGGWGGDSAVSTREVNKWSDMLKLTADQRAAIEALHDAYQEQYRQEAKAIDDISKEARREFMESRDPSVFEGVGAKTAEHTKKMTDLESQFLNDCKSVLDPKQVERWPSVERYHRREKSLPGGMLSGESVDLVSVVDNLAIADPQQGLTDEIERYEIDLDRAIIERDEQRKAIQEQSEKMMKDFDPSKMDFSKIRQLMQDSRKTGIRVRDVNERHARLIAAVLPEDKRADFEQRVRKASYPRVYREPYTSKAIEASLGLADLTSEQKASIETLKASYTRDLSAVNEKWAAAISAEEKDGGGDPFMGFGRFVPGGGGDSDNPSPTEAAHKARREVDKSTLEKLKAVLTPQQAEKLPERGDDNPWMANFGGGHDDAADEKADKKPTSRGGKK